MTQSRPQITYYAERSVQGPAPEIFDNQTVFLQTVNQLHPKYLVLSAYEQSPAWLYAYPTQHPELFTVAQVYPSSQQPLVVVYQFKY